MRPTATLAEQPATHPLALIQTALERGVDASQLERLMSLQERWEASRAAEAFASAVTGFQSECPTVFKRRKASGGKLAFAFASYDDVMREAGPFLAKWRIAVSFSTEPAEGGIKATCRVRVGTHQETTTLTLPVPEGQVNHTQLFGQAVSYAKRYALCAALNIVVTDEDNDAADCMDLIEPAQIGQLNELIESKRVDLDKFLCWAFGVDAKALDHDTHRLDRLSKREYPKVLDMLKRKK